MKESLPAGEPQHTAAYRSLGLLNGLLIGLALALGLWGWQLVTLADLPIARRFALPVLGTVLFVFVGGAAGWLTARVGRAWFTLAVWLAAAMFISFSLDYLLNQHGRSLLAWLADRRFWGQPIYPAAEPSLAAAIFGGLFLILFLTLLALVQDYRLEGAYGALAHGEQLTGSALIRLLLPLPLVFVAGLVTNSVTGGARSWRAAQIAHSAIQVAKDYEGDLFQLTSEEGFNYNALRDVRHLLGDTYTLDVAAVDRENATTVVTAYFNSGGWINCRVIIENLSACNDASLPYTVGFASLLTGAPAPEACRGCAPRITEELAAWLRVRRERFTGQPAIYRLAQVASHVLMRVESPAGDYAMECLFRGVSPVWLESCAEVTPPP